MKRSQTVGASLSASTPAPKKEGGLSVVKPKAAASKGLTVVKMTKDSSKSLSDLETADGMHRFLQLEEVARLTKVGQLFAVSGETVIVASSVQDLTAITRTCGLMSQEGTQIINLLTDSIQGGTNMCEKGLLVLQSLIKKIAHGIEPFALFVLPKILNLHADRSASIRDLAASASEALFKILCPNSFRTVYSMLAVGMTTEDWRVKVGSLQLLKVIAPRIPKQITPLLPQIIPQVSECIYDSKKQVQTAGLDALNEACRAITNDDIRHLVPKLVSVIARPEESEGTLNALLETTFVSNVDAATLALIAPLLGKALKGRSSSLKRKASRVIDIMCRLCQLPSDVAPFMPLLLPALERVIDEVVDDEVVEVAKAAKGILLKAMGLKPGQSLEDGVAALEISTAENTSSHPILEIKKVQQNLMKTFKETLLLNIQNLSINLSQEQSYIIDISIAHMAMLCAHLVVYDTIPNPNIPNNIQITSNNDLWRWKVAMSEQIEWKDCIVPYINALKGISIENESNNKNTTTSTSTLPLEDVEKHKSDDYGDEMAIEFRIAALGEVPDNKTETDEDDASLCDIEFSLAFGGKILLHNTHLRLGKGRRYGVMGKNGSGKTTLLTNIGTGNIEGIPPNLKTVYVQHDDNSEDNGVPLLDEIVAGKDMVEAGVQKDTVEKALKAINFSDTMLHSPRSALSGGWKMKVLIMRAMLSNANVLLLDEPTNHLDAASVQWLTSYLQAQKEVTCLIVSHDTVFLDNVVTDIIHYENKKLVYYHGNLTHFVDIHPEARYYYDLESSTLSFKFPIPGRLEGIASSTRAVMKMDNVTYTYPGAAAPTLVDCSVKVCLSSRVAVIGANGAGKSTLIRMLVRESEPDAGSGEIWQHHNLRVSYIAQHSLHHVEEHLDSSPVDYIKWRFDGGVDKEDLAKPTAKLTEEEEEKIVDRKYGDVLTVIGRRKSGRTMEYDCTWVGQTARQENKYIPLEKMIEMGHAKLVQQCDNRVAAMAAGLDMRPLLTAEIQKHLDDFNLEAEFGTHGTIRRMSGGQKVKLVLAAAMWNCPHVIVLDEPTNYLDRQALGALTQAIKNYGGGVLIISHNKEFTDAICNETWIVQDGHCSVLGEAEETSIKATSEKAIRRTASANQIDDKSKDINAGNVNKQMSTEIVMNPKSLEPLSKKEIRLLSRCAQVAGVSLKEYAGSITWKSPEWKWL